MTVETERCFIRNLTDLREIGAIGAKREYFLKIGVARAQKNDFLEISAAGAQNNELFLKMEPQGPKRIIP